MTRDTLSSWWPLVQHQACMSLIAVKCYRPSGNLSSAGLLQTIISSAPGHVYCSCLSLPGPCTSSSSCSSCLLMSSLFVKGAYKQPRQQSANACKLQERENPTPSSPTAHRSMVVQLLCIAACIRAALINSTEQ